MILGTGVDTVSLSRFESKLAETPRLKDRLFLDIETLNNGAEASIQTLAGRFAAKEAVIKALGGEPGIEWHGIEVGKESSGKPVIWLHGETAKLALRAGVRKLHVSISHDGDVAVAFVVAEGDPQ
ncbi:holo-ACP synthase [Rhodoluna lacicola]|jgi:holo-[acyl-carrier protein] synthase|uniref:Holo-[acyl-carrier-protein] synthase n=1 Tax=Rhodoluna lacicola TaxID=529884 RepID=A0A060JN30_9MICO|nr:holo-ACP synthase [Rhodoluna lacicola]AIC47998.1 phosphopantetheine--protein transferase domain [Rhodoluna lacicola]BDS50905.1 holo-[acyl-carrier-protein] synthase [Rhodoluna lacicola]